MSADCKGFSVETIGKNIASKIFAGYSHKQAIEVTLENARDDYRKKHPLGGLPPHLQDVAGFYRKNPVKAKTRKRVKIKVKSIKQKAGGTISIDGKRVKKNPKSYPNIDKSAFRKGEYVGYATGVWLITKTRTFYGKTKPASWVAKNRDEPRIAHIYADSLADLSHKLELYANDKSPKKNPVRPLKKKLLNKYYLGVSKGTKIYYWINDTRFDTSRKNAAVYTSAETALKKAKNLGAVLNKFIGVYRSK